jgi:hypothetical protein
MTFYEEIRRHDQQAGADLDRFERRSVQHAVRLVTELRSHLGWPATQLKLGETTPTSEWVRVSPHGYINEGGYSFTVNVSAERWFVDLNWSVVAADDEWFALKIDNDIHQVNLDEPESLTPVLGYVRDAVREAMLDSHYSGVATASPKTES